MQYRNYTDEQFVEAVATSFSVAEVLKKLGLAPKGGNYQTVKRNLIKFKLDTEHWTGQAWSKGQTLKEIGSYSKPYKVKEVLAKTRGWQCEHCKNSEWFGQPIPMECHHKDKDRTNNHPDNLMLLCRNCHFYIHGKK